MDIISKDDSIENQYQESADQKKAFIEYLDGLDLSPKEYNAAMFQADYQKAYDETTMTKSQKESWDNWENNPYDVYEFLQLWYKMDRAGKKENAMDVLEKELGNDDLADDFWSNTH